MVGRFWTALLAAVVVLVLGPGAGAFTARQLVYPSQQEYFELPIVHLNDFHARFVQTSPTSGTCHPGQESLCIGGLARVVTATRELLEERPNAIFLNAGDHYQGTLWYNVHRWNATVHFMNKLPHDVMTIGNHDFDDDISGLVPFLKLSKSPIVVTNIDDSEEPSVQGLYKNSTVLVRDGKRIGVIGVILKTTNTLSKTGKLKFLDEVTSINAEAEKLKAQGIEIIIVLSHCGLEVDRVLAAKCPDVDVVVGGHSHTFLYSGKPPGKDVPEDEYPVVVTQTETNRTVLVVQASAYTKYLGNLTVWFDGQGEVADWEGNPVTLDASIVQDPKTLEELKPWEKAVNDLGSSVVGVTKSHLSSSCRSGECNLANLITDSMVHSYRKKRDNPKHWTYAAISCMNAGGIRSSIPEGNITYGDIVTTQPFENTWDTVELKGKDLKDVLEESVLRSYSSNKFVGAGFLHWSGIRLVYNISRPAYSRVIDVHVRCQACEEPGYKDLDPDSWYRVIVPSFVMNGGDAIGTIKKKHRNHQPGQLDVPLIVDYLKEISPFKYERDQRVVITGEWHG